MSLEAVKDNNSEIKYQLGRWWLFMSIMSSAVTGGFLATYGFEAPEDRYELDVEYLAYFFIASVLSIPVSLIFTMAYQPAEIERC